MIVAIAHFIPSVAFHALMTITFVESIATAWVLASIAMVAVVAIIYVSPEVPRPSVPWAGTEECAIRKPLRAIVAVGCAVVGWVIEVAVRASGRRTDLVGDLCVSRLHRRG